MPRYSKAAARNLIRNRSGSISYRVTATVRGKQRKKCFRNMAEAEETQRLWEIERVHDTNVRPTITHLTRDEIRQAEAATELLKGERSSQPAKSKCNPSLQIERVVA